MGKSEIIIIIKQPNIHINGSSIHITLVAILKKKTYKRGRGQSIIIGRPSLPT